VNFAFAFSKIYISSYGPSRKCQMTGSQVFPELWVLCMGLALCDYCSAWNLEVTPRSLEKFWTAILISCTWGHGVGGERGGDLQDCRPTMSHTGRLELLEPRHSPIILPCARGLVLEVNRTIYFGRMPCHSQQNYGVLYM